LDYNLHVYRDLCNSRDVVPWYGFTHGFSAVAWIWFVLLLGANGMAITCGYIDCSHTRPMRLTPSSNGLSAFGAMALQNSALIWSAGHRVHHRHIDDLELDRIALGGDLVLPHRVDAAPLSSGEAEFRTVRDLERDPLLRYQHRYYLAADAGR